MSDFALSVLVLLLGPGTFILALILISSGPFIDWLNRED